MARNLESERLLEQFIAAGRRKPDPEEARPHRHIIHLDLRDKPWFIEFKNSVAVACFEVFLPYFIRGRQREIRFKKTLGQSNQEREQKAQDNEKLYHDTLAKLVRERPRLEKKSRVAQAKAVWGALKLPASDRPSINTIRKKLPRK